MSDRDDLEQRVLVLAPTAKDAAVTERVLGGAGVACQACMTVLALCERLVDGAGAAVVTEEALGSPGIRTLMDWLGNQPAWSDLPILVLVSGGANSQAGRLAIESLGNVTILERPVHMSSLVSVVGAMLRSRKRQYQIREHLEERKRAENEREQILASERAARSEAERVGRIKDDFLGTLSHELRTPLNAILGWSQLLRHGVQDAGELNEGLEIIERNARVQTQIIEDLLDMSRIISGKIRLDVQRIDLIKVVESAIETVRTAAVAREIRIQPVLDPKAAPVSGDPGRLQQVFWNLLSNAIKFTPKGGRVQIVLERVNSHVEVSIVDSGEGIAPEFLPHVFDRFRQADGSTTRRHGGLGLGLAIVKQLVELHGGTVCAKSDGAGTGSTFIVALPMTAVQPEDNGQPARRHPTAKAAPCATPADSVSLDGVKVLVVDDEADARALVRRLLEDRRATVFSAASANEALEIVGREELQVVISDIGMPVEDGYSLIRRLRNLRNAKEVPAIALTAYARSEDRVKAIGNGFQMHLAKPVEPAELVMMVANLAGRSTDAAVG